MDLCADVASRMDELAERIPGDLERYAVNATEAGSLACLSHHLGSGSTGVLLGSSGAGKSTLTNTLLGESIQETGAVREADSRGRHTTTTRQLHLLPAGACLIDTPGVRGLRLDIDAESLDDAFAEIGQLAAHCRFRDCRHEQEPGCAVRAAVTPDRLANYHKLRREIARDTATPLERERARNRAKSLERGLRAVLNRKRNPGDYEAGRPIGDGCGHRPGTAPYRPAKGCYSHTMTSPMRSLLRLVAAGLLCAVWPLLASSSMQGSDAPPSVQGRWVMTNEHGEVLYKDQPKFEFQFARLIYSENPNFARGWRFGAQRWTTDSPAAEIHLSQGIRRLTRVSTAPEGTAVALQDENLFDHPVIYAVEVGGWDLSEKEAARLREYLDRGGTLIVDDFHGSYEWAGFMESLSRVFPDRQVVDIPDDDPIFHVLYDLNDRPQIPGLGSVYRGVTYEQDGLSSALARCLRRQPSSRRHHQLQYGHGRCLGERGQPRLPAAPHRHRLPICH